MNRALHLFTSSLVLFSLSLDSQITVLPKEKRYGSRRVPSRPPRRKDSGEVLDRIAQQNKAIEGLLRSTEKPHFRDETSPFQIVSGTVFSGVLLNPLLSSNLASPVVVASDDKALPQGTRFLCRGQAAMAMGRRLAIGCNVMVLQDKEYPVFRGHFERQRGFGTSGRSLYRRGAGDPRRGLGGASRRLC